VKKENISQIIGHIDENYINEATAFAVDDGDQESVGQRSAFADQPSKQPRRVRLGILAACLATLIVIGFTATAFAVEAEEYKTAVSFFEENGLSTEGLSRSEIKEVYRDITTKSFTFGKTAEVLRRAVPGWEITQDEPTPEEIAAIWDKNIWINSISKTGVSYRIDQQYVNQVIVNSVLERYQDGELIWSAEFKDFCVEDYAYTKEGTVLWGRREYLSYSDTTYGWIALVDAEGGIVWQKRLNHGFKNEYVSSVLCNGDGTWAVISRGDLKYLCLSCYDADGKELSFHKTEVGNFGIQNAARLGDGYIVQLWNQFSGDTALLYKMDSEGVLTDSFSYEADDSDYYITDMVEFEGRVYLSAYTVPKQRDEVGRREIANILEYLFLRKNGGWDITSEELTPLVRDNYTAILLVCDPEGGAPTTFYSVKGSLGGKLSVNEPDRLEWEVKSITTTFYSPATSSFTIGGNCKVFAYSFDTTGNLTDRIDTGESVPFRR